MAIQRNKKNTRAQYFFIFTDRSILVKKDTLDLPDENIFNNLIDSKNIVNWIYEDTFDYVASFLTNDEISIDGYELRLLVDIFAPYDKKGSIVARARGIYLWAETMKYCSSCGSELVDSENETAVDCKKCSKRQYPNFSPAIIVLVKKGDKILLARHSQRATSFFTCLAGYVEQGETLEECVVREVFEEVGLTVKNVQYVKSQPWPFPNQLMFGFTCEWESGEINIDEEELAEADWYDKNNLPTVPFHGTIARYLIDGLY